MTPRQVVLATLQQLGPCRAEEIDDELQGRRRLKLLTPNEWPEGATAEAFLRQLAWQGLAVACRWFVRRMWRRVLLLPITR